MSIPFLSDIILKKGNKIQFTTDAGANAGAIDIDSSGNLVLSNTAGDVLLGDGAADVYIGDGSNNVDILFEQSGNIKADDSASNVTLTLGSSNTTLNLVSPNITGSLTLPATTINNKLTFGTANGYILFDYEPSGDTGEYSTEVPLLKVDLNGSESTILSRLSEYRAVALGIDDTVWLRAGDTSGVIKSNVNLAAEQVVMSAEGGFIAYGFPGNDTTWSNRNEFQFRTDSTTAGTNGLYIGDGGRTQFIDLSRNLKNIGTIDSGAIEASGVVDGAFTALRLANQKTYGSGTGINETVRFAMGISESGAGGLDQREGFVIETYTADESDSSNINTEFKVRDGGTIGTAMKFTGANKNVDFYNHVNLQDGKYLMWGGNTILQHNGTQTYIGDNSSSSAVTITGTNMTVAGTVTANGTTLTGDQDLSGYVTLAGTQTITGSKTFSVQPTFNADTVHNGHIYGRAVNNESSRLYRFGGLWLTWDSDSYGTNFNHSITSTDNGTYSDSITINSYDKVRINIDSNNNDSASTFSVGKHGTGTTGTLLTLEESGNLTVTGTLTATGGNSTNWNTAYGWGDHASAGYLTSGSTQSKYLRSDESDTTSGTVTSTSTLGFKVDSSAAGRIEIEANNNWAYLRLRNNSTVSWDIASYQAGDLELRPAGSGTNGYHFNSSGLFTSGDGFTSAQGTTAYNHSQAAHAPSDADATPSWVPSSDPGYLTSSGTIAQANNLQAFDDRDMAPEDLSYSDDLKLFFSAKEGLEDGTSTGSDWHDVLVLNSYSDSSGGNANVLAFDKNSYKIRHYQAGLSASNWGTAKELAYTDNSSMLNSNTTASDVGLGNVTNESKATMFSGAALTNNPTAPTQSAGNNSTRIATTAFVSTAVSNLVDTAPENLNTLNELAAALGDDENFSTTITNSIGTKLSKSGGTMTGAINMGNFNITGVNALSFNDPGPNEGLNWSNTKIYESPNDLTTNTAGNLQFVYSGTRRLTVNNTGIDVNGNITVSGTVDGVDIAALASANTGDQDLTGLLSNTTDTFTGVLTLEHSTTAGLIVKNSGTSGQDASIVIRGARNAPSTGVNPAKLVLQSYDSDAGSGTNVTGGEFYMESTSLTGGGLTDFEVGVRYRKDGSLIDGFNIHDGTFTVNGNIALSGTVDGRDVAADGTKLDGIASGAEVNVQSNWNATSGDAFIQNKPTIPSGNQIIDWTAENAGTIHGSNYTNTTYSVGDGGLTENNLTNALKSNYDTAYTYSQVGHLPLTGGTLSGVTRFDGGVTIDTATNTNTLNVSRTGSTSSQVMKIGVTDTVAEFNYIEDTSAEGNGNFGQYIFKLGGNDGETTVSALNITKTGISAPNLSGTNTGDQDLSSLQPKPSEGAFADGDKTKLDGIATGADVTPSWVPSSDPGYGTSNLELGTTSTTALAGNTTIPSGNQIIDWTTDQGSTNIHSGNYNNTQLSDSEVIDAIIASTSISGVDKSTIRTNIGAMSVWNMESDDDSPTSISSSETATWAGGTNITTTRSGNTITINSDVTNVSQLTNDAGYLTSSSTQSKYIRSDADDNVSAHTEWQDSKQARFGNSADMKIQHTGTHGYIDNNTGDLYIRTNVNADVGGNIYIRPHDNEHGIIVTHDSDVELYHNNSKKFSTTSNGFECNGTEIDTSSNGGGYKIGFNVADNFSFSGYNVAHYGMSNAGNDTGGGIVLSGYYGIRFAAQGNIRGHISQSGALTMANDVIAFGSPSDISLKENIKPIDNALEKVNKLKGVTFKWKEAGLTDLKEDIGFIAQDVQEVLPELVRENDNGKLSLRDKGIVPVLVEAIKELKAEIDELKKCNKCKNCNCNA